MKKIIPTLLFLLVFITSQAQNKEYTFGRVSNADYNFKKETIDSTANALVLYETGVSKFTDDERNVLIRTTFYHKIKLFNKDGFKYATFSIPIYNNKSNSEKIVDIKGITHNYTTKTHLSLNNVHKEQINANWKAVKFTMPNLKEGSIIEVSYTLVTPFKFNLTGWKFQSDIPKLYSKYQASIPGNYIYNRKLIGSLKLKTNISTIKKNCFSVTGYVGSSNCEEITYAMDNIPAFIEEDYMTSPSNYKSRIKFELSKSIWFDGSINEYTTNWKEVDKEFRTDKNIGGQLRKKKFFEELIPTEIRSIPNNLEKAKAIYTFIQNYFTWNEKYGIFKNARVKEALQNKMGNASEINISLINALKSVGLKTELVLLSTRTNGFPTKVYPVISDFNYVLAKVNINDSYYLLDATNKLNPFGLLPFKCLNSYGRSMDFENESYWIDIVPFKNNKTNYYVNLILNEDSSLVGKMRKVNTGYHALNKRIAYQSKSEDEIISEFEDNFSDITVEEYTIENLNDINKPLIETFELTFDFSNIDKLYLNPFLGGSFKKNPFKQENRTYPVDFGYTKRYALNYTLELPDNYHVISYPKDLVVNLEQQKGNFTNKSRKTGDYKYALYSTFKINSPIFYSHEYNALKKIFEYTINSQKTPIVVEKIKSQ